MPCGGACVLRLELRMTGLSPPVLGWVRGEDRAPQHGASCAENSFESAWQPAVTAFEAIDVAMGARA